MKGQTPRLRSRGVALITAVLMVALATVLAVEVGFKGYLSQRRAITLFAIDQSYEVALGAEALAADILMKDVSEPTTNFTQQWATPIRNLPIDGGELTGAIEDISGRFNLNHLAGPLATTDEEGKKKQQAYIAQFKRILSMANIEEIWADKIVDWIDTDTIPSLQGGEDDVYTTQNPPYLAANRRITKVSELLALPEFGLERYQKLEPLVTALPPDAALNVCTAPGIVLDSFSATQRQFSLDANYLLKQRGNGCFPDLRALEAGLTPEEQGRVRDPTIASNKSSYFRTTVIVTIGTNQFTLYSLLKRGAEGVRPVARSFGTP
jgi:general secretion pathway protein K